MSSSIKPIKLFSHASGPNPWKVAMVLEELGLPHETEFLDFSVLHTPLFEKHNPNGRVPAIIDPNNEDFTLWESGAIIEYLCDLYDPEGKITPKDSKKRYEAKQWLYFQTSGQGPYFGQAAWFHYFHSEKVQTARDRYIKEIQRVTKVLDNALKGKQWLLGDACTYADIAFLPWYGIPPRLDIEQTGWWERTLQDCPDFKAWVDRLEARPAVKKVQTERWAKMDEARRAQQTQQH